MSVLRGAIASVLPMLQAEAEGRMVEHLVIDRILATDIDDEGREVVTDSTVIYDGPGRIRTYRPHEQNPDVGASTITVQRTDWHIPAADRIALLLTSGEVATWAGPVMTGDRARRMTAGRPDKTVRIAGEHDATDQTAQRFVVDEITGGVWS